MLVAAPAAAEPAADVAEPAAELADEVVEVELEPQAVSKSTPPTEAASNAVRRVRVEFEDKAKSLPAENSLRDHRAVTDAYRIREYCHGLGFRKITKLQPPDFLDIRRKSRTDFGQLSRI